LPLFRRRRYETLAGKQDYDGIVALTEKIRSMLEPVAWHMDSASS
jgi:hypothetical protein